MQENMVQPSLTQSPQSFALHARHRVRRPGPGPALGTSGRVTVELEEQLFWMQENSMVDTAVLDARKEENPLASTRANSHHQHVCQCPCRDYPVLITTYYIPLEKYFVILRLPINITYYIPPRKGVGGL